MGSCVGFGKAPWPASFKSIWSPAVLRDGKPVQFRALTESFNSYGFGWILGEFRSHRTISHAGYAGAAILRLPDDGVSVVVLTNLTRDSGSNPQGLALGIAGHYVSGVSWLALKAIPDPAPAVTEELLAELRRLGDGRPALDRYTQEFRSLVEATAPGFQAEARRLGTLESLTLLEANSAAGTRLLLYRANYSRGRTFLRVQLTIRVSLIESKSTGLTSHVSARYGLAILILAATGCGGQAPPPTDPATAMARTVTIYRDRYGVPYVHGPTDASAVFGFAYAQAEDNFPQIEDSYIHALGRAAEAYGGSKVAEDWLNRALEIRRCRGPSTSDSALARVSSATHSPRA